VSIWVPKVLNRSVLNSSNRFPISALVTLAEADFVALDDMVLFPILALLLEYFSHNSTISSKGKVSN